MGLIGENVLITKSLKNKIIIGELIDRVDNLKIKSWLKELLNKNNSLASTIEYHESDTTLFEIELKETAYENIFFHNKYTYHDYKKLHNNCVKEFKKNGLNGLMTNDKRVILISGDKSPLNDNKMNYCIFVFNPKNWSSGVIKNRRLELGI